PLHVYLVSDSSVRPQPKGNIIQPVLINPPHQIEKIIITADRLFRGPKPFSLTKSPRVRAVANDARLMIGRKCNISHVDAITRQSPERIYHRVVEALWAFFFLCQHD
ncbi:hypothetical protein BaRGS_00020923, partial [Batillaria attramentaria]